ncbi:L-asparaginase [Salmonella enterica]|uniref:L-asparaginase n=1 Tax=Salmonella enterica subsp. arizonae TaxID=59203 RepID=A0A5Y3Q8M7_SALER|nr:L-asparaginase [Salmonella enterica subsp. arizonae serovar 63:g,z51:-]EAA8561482.1 L-asparaginase [Salmonella enterica]EAC0103661.1 L-asparaginase [Salmonella enterica subsp. arizonae]EBL3324456.1 L-asparaginase [Salmonella enterica subsp. enterica]EBN1850056.1 L-asparaginase [Salmonella enterica subsp. arizonae serovar 13,23:gz51:-]ECT1273551.1 L-asparaginase [Salmonella enterica subsp. houtenae serovar 48:g,z51:-]ECT9555716.1 L-asparaginase [Salmonella enterica subsp. arizonae serovar 4
MLFASLAQGCVQHAHVLRVCSGFSTLSMSSLPATITSDEPGG